MKIKLANDKKSCRAYGLDFDDKGVCECDKALAKSLIDTGAVIEVKAKSKKVESK